MAWTSFSSSSRPPNSQSFCSLPLNGDVKRWLSLVYLLIYLIWSMSVHDAHMEIEDNLWDSVLSFHHRELNSGLAASTFTYWAISTTFDLRWLWFSQSPYLPFPFFNSLSLYSDGYKYNLCINGAFSLARFLHIASFLHPMCLNLSLLPTSSHMCVNLPSLPLLLLLPSLSPEFSYRCLIVTF